MDWAVALGVAGGGFAGATAVVLMIWLTAPVRRRVPIGGAGRRDGRGGNRRWIMARRSGGYAGGGDGRTAINTATDTTGPVRESDALVGGDRDPRGGLARKSLDSLRVGVIVLDPGDEPVLVNPSARALGLLRVGSQPGTIAAHPVVRSLAAQVRRSGVRRTVELDLPRSGEEGATDSLGVLLRAVGLGGDYIAVEVADVTESHRLARVRRDFVANVGHELKTPTGALQLLSEALLDATEPAGASSSTDPAEDVAAARRFAERIHNESVRLSRLVTELLELSRLQGAEPLPERRPVALDWVVAEALDRARTAASAKQTELTVTGQQGLTVYGSDRLLATAVANLVENAVTYSPEQSEVVIGCHAHEDHIQVSVTDRGIGIAPKELDRIFERFYRSDRARSRATGGTGLGLAIVKHIATNHGGRVDVTSSVGEGSTFTLRLPARPPDAETALPTFVEIEGDRAVEGDSPDPGTPDPAPGPAGARGERNERDPAEPGDQQVLATPPIVGDGAR